MTDVPPGAPRRHQANACTQPIAASTSPGLARAYYADLLRAIGMKQES